MAENDDLKLQELEPGEAGAPPEATEAPPEATEAPPEVAEAEAPADEEAHDRSPEIAPTDPADGGPAQPSAEDPGIPGQKEDPQHSAKDLEAVFEIPVQVSAVLGTATMRVSQLLKLGRGAVVELDRKVGEAIDIYVNNRLVARGEVVVVEDRLGVTMTEIIKADRST